MSTGTQTEVVMPQMGVSVSEGTITKWLKQPGEQVDRDEPLLEISTDKVDTEIPSPVEGVVAEILVQEGETVEVGTVIARIAPAGAEIVEAPAEPAPAEAAPEPIPEPAPEPVPEPVAAAAPPPEPVAAAAPPPSPPRRRLLRRLRPPSPFQPRPLPLPPGTAGASSPRWSRASRPSTASIRRRSPAPAPAGA